MRVQNAKDRMVEMLMNHTAGIPEYVDHLELLVRLKQHHDKIWSVEERFDFIKNDPPRKAPGKDWAYTNSHYLIPGIILEKVTGKLYFELLNMMILKPCKLINTITSDRRSLPGPIHGYTALCKDFPLPHKVLIEVKYSFNHQGEWTVGGLVTTGSYLTSWRSQLNGRNEPTPETKNLMSIPFPFITALFENAKYGIGCLN